MSIKLKSMTRIAMMTVIIVVCSWLTVPFVVPITMQTFGVFCALLLLGGKFGLISIALYLALGAVGLPVFSSFQGGIGHLLGPTGGYLIGFLVMAAVYTLAEPIILKNKKYRVPVLLAGLLLCYLFGTIWFSIVYQNDEDTLSFVSILSMCVLPYAIPDCIKLCLSVYVSKQVANLSAAGKG